RRVARTVRDNEPVVLRQGALRFPCLPPGDDAAVDEQDTRAIVTEVLDVHVRIVGRSLAADPDVSVAATRVEQRGTAIFVYGRLVYLRGGRDELADRQPGMMTLISLAITVAFVMSWAGTLGLFDVEIRSELATLITRSCCSATGRRCARSPRPKAPGSR